LVPTVDFLKAFCSKRFREKIEGLGKGVVAVRPKLMAVRIISDHRDDPQKMYPAPNWDWPVVL